ncbi:DUF3833 family protein [Lysobacter sp. A3-1-A15]|uniref:DUF3833 family protein n=1 Tax=Novilysobacter viscosus TaxID=3098602 RepID=UPI002ED98F0F
MQVTGVTEFRFLLAVAGAALLMGAPSLAEVKPIEFTPRTGFSGESEGNGTLTFLLGKPRPFRVESLGRTQADGTFRLEQRIFFQGKPPRDRVWVITSVGPGRYSATLSDAAGPVTGVTSGSRLTLHYRAKGPLFVRQDLRLLPDGRTIDNVGVITLFGIPVGHLKETIIRKSAGRESGNPL